MVMDEDLGTTGGEAGQVQAGPVGAKQQAAWQKKDAHTGAPCPLAPELVTLSLLPRYCFFQSHFFCKDDL